ncbi:hypothetical protein SEA_SPILLED_221 [Streptomyces phage Spilled]|uniref:Uncharacterized protein n=1 Tax=Streptomyces phage Starbow TaxID=2283266 RepID=A0A345M857_9CAUD|nr:hypothetical protein [Streptomyces sp. JV178]AXH66678.1 hypothetical protein SEA_STARBOW_211 [Streptomyces phage Starbow]QDF17340.1 hypothetical protein SEA_BIRCHLYN_213 [Streptomyces phage Birchlyn]QFP97489.1 hypothetical protein SEA_ICHABODCRANE_209 [Streptomyces phage IchabodCrane]QGH74416.1 hypothetical protein SEA_WIPEOUT_205 [Streptomyces phage Wipeout]QGH79065.1 hypothetical protein SEA_TOMSAWYER_218 [Streptomyces phage TomSawyer]QPL13809.1 hypothetical protein SEA_MINDFLAYER_207 [S
MNQELKNIVDTGKKLGNMTLDVIELLLVARKADMAQRKAAEAYISMFEEQRGKVKTEQDWKILYNGVKKRLTV